MRYIFYHGQFTAAGVRNLEHLTTDAWKQGLPDVTVCICSPGGDVNGGIGYYNFVRMLPINVHMHCFGFCDSIAATVLMAGATRTVAALTSIIVHQAIYTDGPQKGQRSPNTDLIAGPFQTVAGWSAADVSARFGRKEFRMTAADAVTLGVAQSITAPLIVAGDDVIHVAIP